MYRNDTITTLIRSHYTEFKQMMDSRRAATGESKRVAKKLVTRQLINKYQSEYVKLRGVHLKGGHVK